MLRTPLATTLFAVTSLIGALCSGGVPPLAPVFPLVAPRAEPSGTLSITAFGGLSLGPTGCGFSFFGASACDGYLAGGGGFEVLGFLRPQVAIGVTSVAAIWTTSTPAFMVSGRAFFRSTIPGTLPSRFTAVELGLGGGADSYSTGLAAGPSLPDSTIPLYRPIGGFLTVDGSVRYGRSGRIATIHGQTTISVSIPIGSLPNSMWDAHRSTGVYVAEGVGLDFGPPSIRAGLGITGFVGVPTDLASGPAIGLVVHLQVTAAFERGGRRLPPASAVATTPKHDRHKR